MYDTQTTETTTERKPPTIADIVREKTDGGAMIIDFFTDVMTGRIEGAELCHRIDAAKHLVKFGSEEAAEFIAKYKGIPCGHSTGARPDSDDPCTDAEEERTPVIVDLIAPATITREFLTVLSGIDEFLMRQLIRAQTADGGTIVEFLDEVMHGREPTFRTRHRLAAAKELIAHILRDEASIVVPAQAGTQRGGDREGLSSPSPSTGEGWGEGERGGGARDDAANADHTTVVPAQAGTQRGGGARDDAANADNTAVVPAQAGTQRGGGARDDAANVDHTTVVPAQAGTQKGGGARDDAANADHTTVVPAKAGTQGAGVDNSKPETLPTRRPRRRLTRKQRRMAGNARAAMRKQASESERMEKDKDEKPAPVALTPAEQRIRQKLEAYWHEPDPDGAPIDSTTPGRSPPW